MNAETKNALTPLDLCILIAHEAASLLWFVDDALEEATRLRDGLEVLSKAHDLENSTAPLMAWIESELEIERRFTTCGEDSPHLIHNRRLIPVLSPSAQVEAVMALFETAVQTESPDKRQALYGTAQTLTDLGCLSNMLLNISPSGSKLLTVADLRAELEDVRAALRAPESVTQSDSHSASP